MFVYVSGPYTAAAREKVSENIAAARKVAIALHEKGHAVFCPHLETAHFEDDCTATYEHYLDADLQVLSVCDAIVLLPNWHESKGASAERQFAEAWGIPIYEWPNIPELHPTEKRCPQQVRCFRNVLGKLYRTHLQKNADYSPANILATGEIGLVTRLWDKVARLLNLSGFHIRAEFESFDAPKNPNNESIDDTYLDLAVYGIIGTLLRRGAWGR